MFNESAIKGLRLIAEGFTKLAEALEESPVNAVTTSEVAEKPVKKTEAKAEPVESDSDDLAEMSYNNLKKLAKELGISAKGGRNELISAITAARAEQSEDEEEEDEAEVVEAEAVEEESEADDAEDAEDEDEEDSEDEDDEDEEQSTADAVAEATEDMSDAELKELLESVGLSTKGKRTALLDRIVKAVDDGLISLDDDEDEEDEEEADEADAEDDSEEEAEESEAEDDADVTKGMSKKRKKAYEELCDSTTNDFNTGDIERQDLVDFISEYHGLTTKQAKTQYKNTKDEELLDEYLRLMVNFIDDDGEVVEEGAYTINDVPYCCGHELDYNKKTKKYTCSVCGEEYEAED